MNRPSVRFALEVMDRHIEALNARDDDALVGTLHFPHIRLSGTALKIWDTPEHYFNDFLQRAGGDWCYSRFVDIKLLQASDDKAHLDAEIRRYRADDSLITSFRSLWVIVCIDGVWAAKMRSSFAAQ